MTTQVPRGNAVWSPRLEESLAAGCIPIIISDLYDLPFVHVLDYSKFSLRIAQKDFSTLPERISALGSDQRDELRRNGQVVANLFTFRAHPAEPTGHDSTPLVAFELWARVHQLTDRYRMQTVPNTW